MAVTRKERQRATKKGTDEKQINHKQEEGMRGEGRKIMEVRGDELKMNIHGWFCLSLRWRKRRFRACSVPLISYLDGVHVHLLALAACETEHNLLGGLSLFCVPANKKGGVTLARAVAISNYLGVIATREK